MTDAHFNIVLERIAAGDSFFAACQIASITPAMLTCWITQQDDSLAYYMALNMTRADRLLTQAGRLQTKLSERIDLGLVRTSALAQIETDQINRLFVEAENLRFLVERQLSAAPMQQCP